MIDKNKVFIFNRMHTVEDIFTFYVISMQLNNMKQAFFCAQCKVFGSGA